MALTIVETRAITGGVDTHADVHAAAALDLIGGCPASRSSRPRGRRLSRLLGWLGGFGSVCLLGIEGTAVTARAWPATSLRPACASWRRTVPIARTGAWRKVF